VNATARIEPLSHYRAQFDAVKHALPGDAAAREAAFTRFQKLGFPTQREEAWKYTNLRRLETRSFVAADRGAAIAALVPPLGSMGLPRIAFVDGYVRRDLTTLATPPAGVTLRSAAEVARAGDAAGRSLRIPSGGGTERFGALNAALSEEPLLIDVDAEDAALHVVCIASSASLRMSHPRLQVRLADNARLRLVLEHVGNDAAEGWVNSVVDIELGRGATLDLYRLQHLGARTFHTERIDARVGADSRLLVRDATLGSTLARLDLVATLEGKNAAVEATGLFLADGSRHLDTQLRVDHQAPATTSLQEYRGIAAGRGRGVFNTKVVVHPGAQKTNARQSSRNLLLTTGAEIDTKPELEIYADDVQCGHGATTGQLDANALFYLRSRGISATEARRLLTRAFAASVLARMDLDGYAAVVHAALDARLDALLESVE